jgi:hypothetical protein
VRDSIAGGPIRARAERLDIEPHSFDIDAVAIARRKEELRRVWRYEPVDHVPVTVDLSPVCGETVRDAHLDASAWFSSAVRHIEWSLAALPDDYIPLVRPPWLGFHTVPAMFGAQIWWADDPHAMPAVKEALVTTVDQLWELLEHDPRRDGHCPEILRRLQIAAACFPPEVAIAGVDMASPLGDVLELMDQTLFFVSLKRSREAIHHACEVVTRTQLAVQEAALAALGGSERMAAVGKWPTWRPEFGKCLVTDDIASLLSPAVFEQFDQPYTDRLIRPYGGGLLHICGPNPSARLYMHDDPPIYGLNCSFRYSRGNLDALKEELGPRAEARLRRRGHLEVMFERGVPLADMVRDFRELADVLAPDLVALPYCQVLSDGSVSSEEIGSFYAAMRTIAEDYAGKMRWKD